MNNKNQNEILLSLLDIPTSVNIDIEKITHDEWNDLIEKAKSLRVASILYYSISKSDKVSKIPKDVLMSLRKTYLYYLSINMRLQKELSIIIDKMQSEGIKIIILKGFALGETVYNNIALRPMVDIDMIVNTAHFKSFDRIMLNLGWKNKSFMNRLGFNIEHNKHIEYSKDKLYIEVHPKIYELPLIDPWERAIKTEIAGTKAFILGNEDFFMHLCLHLEYHGLSILSNLLWYIDILEFMKIHQDNIDWDYIINTAIKNKVNYHLYKILESINSQLGGNISKHILNQLESNNSSQSKKMITDLMARIFGHDALPIHVKTYITFRSIFPSKDYIIYHYSSKHPRLFFIYYFVHIKSGVKKLFNELIKIIFPPKHKKS